MAEGINIEQIVQEVLDRILQSSTGVEDMETVTSLTGVKSLPGQKGDKLVNVPFELISKVANDAATRANAAAKEAEESIAGLEDKTQDAIDATKGANDAAAKAEDAVELVENTTTASLQGATARFSGIIEEGEIKADKSTVPGGEIVWVRNAKRFAYRVEGSLHGDWESDGIPSSAMFQKNGIPLADKLYMQGTSLYVLDAGDLKVLAYRHEPISEDDFEALPEKDDNILYLIYEED